jgi:hypothetical protein
MAQFEITCPSCGSFCILDMVQEDPTILNEILSTLSVDVNTYSYSGRRICPECEHIIRATLVVSSIDAKLIDTDSDSV